MIIGFVCGMKYMHSKGIIHRDLKPRNLLIDSEFRLRISGFDSAVLDGSTTTGIYGGAYMAPEIFENAIPTKKVDVFVFGLILYELYVGESVFPENTGIPRLYKLHRERWRPEIPGYISEPIARLIRDCWSPEPESRPSFEEIYARLDGINFAFFDDVSPEVVRAYVSEINGFQGRS
jgi:serine/threonine protein kinase